MQQIVSRYRARSQRHEMREFGAFRVSLLGSVPGRTALRGGRICPTTAVAMIRTSPGCSASRRRMVRACACTESRSLLSPQAATCGPNPRVAQRSSYPHTATRTKIRRAVRIARDWSPLNLVKTQGSLPGDDAALVLLFRLVASGQIRLRRIDGWRKISTTKPEPRNEA